jgi:hypothetical protein
LGALLRKTLDQGRDPRKKSPRSGGYPRQLQGGTIQPSVEQADVGSRPVQWSAAGRLGSRSWGWRGGSVAAQEKPPAPSRRCGGFPSGRSAKPITRGPDARLKAIPEIFLRTRRENARTPLPGPTECFGGGCRSSFRRDAGVVAWPGERDHFRFRWGFDPLPAFSASPQV